MRSLVAQAVAELHLGRTEEAQAALEEAVKKEPTFTEAIANLLVLTVVTGQDPTELKRCVSPGLDLAPCLTVLRSNLEKVDPQHPFLVDLAEKSELFDKAATKYKAKVAAA